MNVRQRLRTKQQTDVKDAIMAGLLRCLQEDLYSDCYLVTLEGIKVPAHKGDSQNGIKGSVWIADC